MLALKLVPLGVDYVRGIYKVDGKPARLPARMRLLHPSAAAMFNRIAHWAVVSDMFRSPESSLQAVREGRGAQRPGYSGHNYGLSIDLDLEASMERLAESRGLARHRVDKTILDLAMRDAGWWCHRLDHKMEFEAWHFNALWPDAKVYGTRTSDELEKLILRTYGADLRPDARECQHMLKKLRMYSGEIDGIIGRLSREGTEAFQRTWGIKPTGDLDERTRRTLAYVTCAREMVLEAPQ